MGYNSTILVLNDALDNIRKDQDFGKKIAAGILHLGIENKEPIDICSGNHINAASVIETHHAAQSKIILIGGNTSKIIDDIYLSSSSETPELDLLKILAIKHGYNLHRRQAKK